MDNQSGMSQCTDCDTVLTNDVWDEEVEQIAPATRTDPAEYRDVCPFCNARDTREHLTREAWYEIEDAREAEEDARVAQEERDAMEIKADHEYELRKDRIQGL